MNLTHADFITNYANLSQSELMEIARSYETLTDVAQAALREEFARRRLEPPLLEENEPREPPAQRNLVTVRQYRDLPDAEIARSVLESAGVTVYMRDENLVRLDWPLSNLLGGVRIQVDATDEQSALELLSQPLPEAISFGNGEDFNQPHCPTCGSSDVVLSQFYGAAQPLPAGSSVWRCNACEECWEQPED